MIDIYFNFRIHEVTPSLLSKLIEKIENLVVVFYDMEVRFYDFIVTLITDINFGIFDHIIQHKTTSFYIAGGSNC